MPLLNINALVAKDNQPDDDLLFNEPLTLEGPEPKPKEHTTLVATCEYCRGWYNQDMEEGLPDDHFDMRTGEPCHNEYHWRIFEVPDREDWQWAR